MSYYIRRCQVIITETFKSNDKNDLTMSIKQNTSLLTINIQIVFTTTLKLFEYIFAQPKYRVFEILKISILNVVGLV